MLDHSLEVVAYTLKLRHSYYLLPVGALPEGQAQQSEPKLRHAPTPRCCMTSARKYPFVRCRAPSARRVFGWLVGWRKLAVEEPKSADHDQFVQALCKIEPVVGEVRSLAREFLGLMHRRSVRHFDRWFKRLSCCDAAEMRGFAQSLRVHAQ